MGDKTGLSDQVTYMNGRNLFTLDSMRMVEHITENFT